jgi:hypothetical protein
MAMKKIEEKLRELPPPAPEISLLISPPSSPPPYIPPSSPPHPSSSSPKLKLVPIASLLASQGAPNKDMGPVEISPITTAMEQVIQDALSSNEGRKLVEAYNIHIFVKDLRTFLADPTGRLNWLNDEVINFYMGIIARRSEGTEYRLPKVFCIFFLLLPQAPRWWACQRKAMEQKG